ncbi:MAG: hypothetical protein ACREML_00110, partial [Vulcanimicrobiaceae bacterium]
RLAAKRLSHTPASVSLAGEYLFGARPVGKKALRQTIRLLARNGVARIDCYDPFNDIETLRTLVAECKELGLLVGGGIVYALGEAYDADYFSSKAQTLVELGCDAVQLLDFSGMFHPERVPELIPALVLRAGRIPLELRTHCRSSRAEISCLSSLDNGVAAIHAASEPLSGGVSLPSIDFFAEHLVREGYRSSLDDVTVAAISDYFTGLAEYHGLPKGAPMLYDVATDRYQLPAVLQEELTESERFRRELARICADLDDPPMALPVATWLCEQVASNLETGSHGSAHVRVKMRADKTAGGNASEDEITALHLSEGAMRSFVSARARADRSGWEIYADSPQAQLLGELARRPWIREIFVESRA